MKDRAPIRLVRLSHIKLSDKVMANGTDGWVRTTDLRSHNPAL